jgi:hypothetical protein
MASSPSSLRLQSSISPPKEYPVIEDLRLEFQSLLYFAKSTSELRHKWRLFKELLLNEENGIEFERIMEKFRELYIAFRKSSGRSENISLITNN